MRVLVAKQEMPLMTLATCVRITVLTDNLRISLTLVFLKTNETFHGVLLPMWGNRINFTEMLRDTLIPELGRTHRRHVVNALGPE